MRRFIGSARDGGRTVNTAVVEQSMAVKLTKREIERLTCLEGSRDKLVFDTEQKGLAVRVMAAGSKS